MILTEEGLDALRYNIDEEELCKLSYDVNEEEWQTATLVIGFTLLKGMSLEMSFQEDGPELNQSDKRMIIKLVENSDADMLHRMYNEGVKKSTDKEIENVINFLSV